GWVRPPATSGGRGCTGAIPPTLAKPGHIRHLYFHRGPGQRGCRGGGQDRAPAGPRAPHHGKAGGAAASRLISKASGKARTSALSAITYGAVYQKRYEYFTFAVNNR